MRGIVNSAGVTTRYVVNKIAEALQDYLPKSGGEITGEITGSDDTTSINIVDGGIAINKAGDAESQETGGTISDSVHTTYYGIQMDSTDEADTTKYGQVQVTPEYVQTNSGLTSYEKLSPTTYDVEVGNQPIIHYDATTGLQLKNVAEPTSDSDVATKGYTDTAVDDAVSTALADGGVIDSAIDTAISDLANVYVPKTTTVNGKPLSGDITIDASDISALPLTGGTLTGSLTLNGAPTSDNMAATKKYVDDSIAASASTDSPEFTGTPKAPTAPAGTNTTQIATTEFVQTAVSGKADDTDVVHIAGTETITGDKTFSGVLSAQTPTANTHVATKKYVDDAITQSGGVVVDPSIDGTSENPVQNKAIKQALDNKVDAVAGKGLSTNDFTNELLTKVNSVESGAEENVIEGVTVNGTDATITNKKVEISVPTKTSDLTNDSDFVADASYVHTDNNYTSTDKNKLSSIASGAEANVIEGVTVNGSDATITNKKAIISVPTKTSDLTNDSNFVADGSYVHTDNNYTTTDKNKLSAVESGAEVNVIDTISINGTDATVTNKKVDITVPTKVSDITNDSGFQTASDVASAINSAIGGITSISFEVVTSLPATGQNGVIYLMSNGGTDPNIYDEYIYVNNNFEKIGTTEVDLSNYLQLSGGTMTGALTLSGDPTSNLHASTKQYVDNSIASVSTAVSGKQDTITGAASTITSADLTASKVLISDGSGKVSASTVTTTELGYLSGITSSVQTQIDAKANKGSIVKSTLSASGWSSGVYSFESTYPNASYDISIEPNGATITTEQYEAWSKAQVLGNPDANTIKALGTVPTVDIPIVLSVVPK